MKNLLNSALKVSGEKLIEYFDCPIETQQKESQSSIVTEADIESEKIIIKLINDRFPEHNIISEESGFTNNNSNIHGLLIHRMELLILLQEFPGSGC